MRAAWGQPGLVAPLTHLVAEAGPAKRLPVFGHEEGLEAHPLHGTDRLKKLRCGGKPKVGSGLALTIIDLAVLQLLRAKQASIPAPLAGPKHDLQSSTARSTMPGVAGELAATIARWPNVSAYTHWQLGSPGVVDGAEFHVGDPELGHIHLDGSAHIPLTGEIATLLESKGLGRTPYWSNAWITFPVRSSADVARASWLFRLAYARIRGASDDEVLDRVRSGAGLTAG